MGRPLVVSLVAVAVSLAACSGADDGASSSTAASASGAGGGGTTGGPGGAAAGGASSTGGGGAPTTGGGGGSAGGASSTSTATGSGGSGAGTTSATGGAGGAGGAPFVPDPIPDIADDLPPPCPAAEGAQDYFEFLDDLCERKRLPPIEDRAFACPIVDATPTIELADGSTVEYAPPDAPVVVDAGALVGVVPPAMRVAVILVRRVGGVPHFRYLSNGTHDDAIQPWSTSKFLAAANAAATLRIQSKYAVGLGASVDGHALGDLVTSLVDYENAPYSSNALGRYFHNIGGRAKANDLIHAAWLGRPADETFGGNYGAAAPPLGYTFVENGASVSIAPDQTAGPANHLSMRTLAEALKRLVLHREVASQRLPGIQQADLEALLYGAEASPKGPFGGMSRDTAIYLQAAHDIDYLEARSHGAWRIYSKLGLGSQGQFLDVGYGCFPVLDDAEQPVPGWGRELVIAAQLDSGGATWAERDRILATAYRAIVKRVVDGRL